MMRFAEIVKLLAAPFPVQDAFLGDVPENTSVADFDACNDVFRMAMLFLESLAVSECDGGSEGVEHWRARTEISLGEPLPTQWLAIAVGMLVDLNQPFLYTRHGLRSAHQWRLVRYLAATVCEEMGWSREIACADFATLWHELGQGVIDEKIEQTRWRNRDDGETI